MVEGIRYAHARGREVLMAINTFPQPGRVADWHSAVDGAADLGVDAVILADIGLLDYASQRHPICACTSRCRARPPATRRSISASASSASGAPCCRAC